MTVFCSSRRIALVLALALLGLAWPVSAVQAGAFRASGTQVLTDSKANTFGGTLSGRAMSGGSFTGTFSGEFRGSDKTRRVDLVETWDFGGGDTLTFTIHLENDETGDLLVGTYVITGGTGRLEDASGSGSFTLLVDSSTGTAEFALDGTLSH